VGRIDDRIHRAFSELHTGKPFVIRRNVHDHDFAAAI